MNIVKKDDASPPVVSGGKLRSQGSTFQQRIAANKVREADAATLPNRIALMLDCSGSMAERVSRGAITGAKSKIDHLKDAVMNFVQRCNFVDTGVAIETFPHHKSIPLSNNQGMLMFAAQDLEAGGGTPMYECAKKVLEEIPLTRGIIVSDGCGDWYVETDSGLDDAGGNALAKQYKDLHIPIDCVHIGSDTSGEEMLKAIASATGGLYIKFTNVGSFSTAFGYLTPAFRGMLTSGSVDAAKLGAKEVV